MEPQHITAIAQVFRNLDFHPPNGFKFWEKLESVLEHKFSQFRQKEMIDMLVSFLCIEKYPLNFTNMIFNPFFLDRLHAQDEEAICVSRQQLKLYDTGMKLECRGYEGPFLPKDTKYRQVYQDSRVLRLAGRGRSSTIQTLF